MRASLCSILLMVWAQQKTQLSAFPPTDTSVISKSCSNDAEPLHLSATLQEDPLVSERIDTRPHDHRAKQARKARRLNHAFRYLYRHHNTAGGTNFIQYTSKEYLVKFGGYSEDQIDKLHEMFPPLLEIDVARHLRPKLRFLKETLLELKDDSSTVLPDYIRETLPPRYFGARLERIVAPRHAFLVHSKLPHGRHLLLPSDGDQLSTRWQEFLTSCRNAKQFAALCNQWAKKEALQKNGKDIRVTPKQIDAFDTLFQRGLMAAARDELCQHNNTWPLQHINITSGEMIKLLVQHGANPLERDNRGVSLLHWAAGTGNLDGVEALLPFFTEEDAELSGFFVQNERDGATPLHWAAAGANAREFGVGGHPDVCLYILSRVAEKNASWKRKLVNQLTKDGNSALMWAAWSGTLETVRFLIRERADPSVANRNGCTVAHWASSGGNVDVCRYLACTVGVDFTQPNHGGNTPLTHAVAFGRVGVVDWLRNDIVAGKDDNLAASLAWDFVDWTDGEDEKRQDILKLFGDWYHDHEGS